MHTTLYLIRNGATEWTREGKIAGRRELGLSTQGRVQADELGERLAQIDLVEILSSPLPRAVETAERMAQAHHLEVARDPRLTDFHVGQWEGLRFAELLAHEGYRKFLADPEGTPSPGGEKLADVRDRMISSVSQALADNELGAGIAVVSHAGPLRVLLAHYLGMRLATFHHLRVSAGSVTALRFDSEDGMPRLLALNCLGDVRAATI
jgi:broad specificity phosphatase PhoE